MFCNFGVVILLESFKTEISDTEIDWLNTTVISLFNCFVINLETGCAVADLLSLL